MSAAGRVDPAERRASRERALGLLYEAETRELAPRAVLEAQATRPDRYATELVTGVGDHAAELDRLIAEHATGWTLGRMPAVDRALARLATFELVHRPDVPTGVVLSEAVELAGAYSTDDSGRYLNGLLAGIAGHVREAAPGVAAAESPGGE
ncbi:MAG: transcription antitermination factor NusB [Acidimicrobiia bacterium]|nr:transcription antitermination factor NusB [Acidimicrobiia bacterium]